MFPSRSKTPTAWLLGALALVPVELAALGSARSGIVWTSATLLLTLGLVCGLCIVLAERLAARLALGSLATACVRALPAALPLAFVAAHLFDGGLASTLPGAAWGAIWVPIAGTAMLAVALWLADKLLARPGIRILAVIGTLALAAVAELANRTVYPTLYDDIHAFLTLFAVVCAGTAVRLALAGPASRSQVPGRDRRWLGAALAASAVAISFGLVLKWGLQDSRDRLAVATSGMHTRQLARLVRLAADRDGDGHATVLGGGDCDDGNRAINPEALDVPANGRDEDCDGTDATPLPTPRIADQQQALAAWRQSPDVRAVLDRTRQYHVVFILVDSLRADMLADTEDSRRTFPNLHALAAEARWFRRAFSTAAGTDVAVATLLTGHIDPFSPVATTLLEALSAAGLATHAVLPREVLRWAGKTLLTRGLGSHDRVVNDRVQRDVGSHTTGHQTTAHGLAALERHKAGRLFLWLHYFDVHEHHELQLADERLRAVLGNNTRPDRATKYRAVTQLLDQEIGLLIAGLKERGHWDRTVVILLADHGESLGEDPRLGDTHGRYLYNPLIHVPLLVRIPGVPAAVIDDPVSLLDVPPTVIELTGAQQLADMNGRSLLPYLLDGAPAELRDQHTPIVLNESDQYGIIAWPHKLLVRPAENVFELYNLETDFAETQNLYAREPARGNSLNNLYKHHPRVIIDRSRQARQQREAAAREGQSD